MCCIMWNELAVSDPMFHKIRDTIISKLQKLVDELAFRYDRVVTEIMEQVNMDIQNWLHIAEGKTPEEFQGSWQYKNWWTATSQLHPRSLRNPCAKSKQPLV